MRTVSDFVGRDEFQEFILDANVDEIVHVLDSAPFFKSLVWYDNEDKPCSVLDLAVHRGDYNVFAHLKEQGCARPEAHYSDLIEHWIEGVGRNCTFDARILDDLFQMRVRFSRNYYSCRNMLSSALADCFASDNISLFTLLASKGFDPLSYEKNGEMNALEQYFIHLRNYNLDTKPQTVQIAHQLLDHGCSATEFRQESFCFLDTALQYNDTILHARLSKLINNSD